MTNPEITAFFDNSTNTITYIVTDPKTKACAIIDSVLDYDCASGRTDTQSADKVIAFIRDNGLKTEWILETHAHADHLSAAPYLQEQLGGKIAIGSEIKTVQNVFGKIFNEGTKFERDGSQFDALFSEGDTFKIGQLDVKILHTPGHTPACMTYIIGDAAFVGDAIFMPDFGTPRTDFPGGDARTLYKSIQKILSLPPETRIFVGHDYKSKTRDNYAWETTVAEQREKNIHVHEGVSEDEFVKMREARDATLSMPKLILPSIQVNMRAGQMPPPEDNGQVYFKVPVDAL